ncbi:kinase-like domain-containing protein [Schizophyllum amplum]|uniref:Kinase-like domain-containing protein n=1 Tax=Schizophyllum amplum TaxID=97359 RepID=A0A550C8G6_9AGAR|nr:kinase-like domain-containing protein [Auriculariopsis ampla]
MDDAERKRKVLREQLRAGGSRLSFSRLTEGEEWWASRQPWLESCGYILRQRYRPGWEASWHGTQKDSLECEDHMMIFHWFLLDATRASDGKPVILKRINTVQFPDEVEITSMLSASPFASDHRNRCVPCLDVLRVPDEDSLSIIVLPLLRRYDDPRFDTVGEVVDCLGQILECVQFLHDHQIAHRDIKSNNIMMDASNMYPHAFHPRDQTMRADWEGRAHHYSRTERLVRYHLIDFGLSTDFGVTRPPYLDYPALGGYKTVPEFQGDGYDKMHDPFPTDVYYLGTWIRQDFLEGRFGGRNNDRVAFSKRLGLEFLRPLVDEMMREDPAARPSIDEVMDKFNALASGLSSWKLRSRVAKENDHPLYSMYLSVTHWCRRLKLVATRRPAIPCPDGTC